MGNPGYLGWLILSFHIHQDLGFLHVFAYHKFRDPKHNHFGLGHQIQPTITKLIQQRGRALAGDFPFSYVNIYQN